MIRQEILFWNVQFLCHRSWVWIHLDEIRAWDYIMASKKERINKSKNSPKIYKYIIIIIIITQSVVTYNCCSYFIVTVTLSVPSHNECTGGGSATYLPRSQHGLLWCCCTALCRNTVRLCPVPQTQHVVFPCFTLERTQFFVHLSIYARCSLSEHICYSCSYFSTLTTIFSGRWTDGPPIRWTRGQLQWSLKYKPWLWLASSQCFNKMRSITGNARTVVSGASIAHNHRSVFEGFSDLSHRERDCFNKADLSLFTM